MHDLLSLIERFWPYGIVLAPGLWALYLRWTDLRKGRVTDKADLIRTVQEASSAFIDDLRDEIDRLRGRLLEVERELADLQKRHTEMIADKDAKITLLEGEKRALEAKVAAYEDFIRRHNLEPPKLSQQYWRVADGEVTPAVEAPHV